MEIVVKVQIDISEDTKAFVSALLSTPYRAEKDTVSKEVKVPPISESPITPGNKSADTKVVKSADTKPAKEVANTNPPVAKPADTKAGTVKITLTDVRAKTAPLVEIHRQAIMEKLRELGAANVSTLKEEHFPAFITFLDTLK